MLPDRTKSGLSTLYTRRQLQAPLRVRDFFDNCAAKVSLRALTFGLTLSLTPATLLVVGRAAAVLDSFYFSPELGKRMADSLRARLARGTYDRYRNGPGLALRLNADLAEIAHDKHLGISYVPTPPPKQPAGEAPPAPSHADLDETNCGFKKVEQLDGNIGYLRFDSFEEAALCGSTASAAMTFLAGTRALIIDLRENGGGHDIGALIASYLFDRRTHLDDLWDRYANSTRQSWTQDSVPGRRFGGTKPKRRPGTLSCVQDWRVLLA